MISISIEKWLNCADSAFSSSWDDMTISSIFDITDEANKRNIKTTIYINCDNKEWKTDLFYGNDHKNTSDLVFNESIKKRLCEIHLNGNEIGNHTSTHKKIKDISYDLFKKEICDCNTLIENITKQKTYTFCYPNGTKTNDYKKNKYLKNTFISCRCADYSKNNQEQLKLINTYENINFNLLKTFHVGSYPYEKSVQDLNFVLDHTLNIHGWLIEYGHGWENDAWKPVSKNILLDHYDYVSKKNIWCSTILNISKYIKQKKNINYKLEKINNNTFKLFFSNVLNDSELTFSLVTNNKVKITQDDKLIQIKKIGNKLFFNLCKYSICVITILQ